MKQEVKKASEISLGTVQLVACSHCGKTHEFISSYNEMIARVQYRAKEHCIDLMKKGNG
jgi:hypothetical protein|tara:strand:+ start:156 stop:332 length:177 start_codon:yes stop_codon:yes gene_type:complete